MIVVKYLQKNEFIARNIENIPIFAPFYYKLKDITLKIKIESDGKINNGRIKNQIYPRI